MNLELVDFDADETLLRKGDLGTEMYIIIIDGTVSIHDGVKVVRELGARSIVGELAALHPEPRSASVTAVESTRLFKLDQATLLELVSDQPEIVRGVLRVLCELVRWASQQQEPT